MIKISVVVVTYNQEHCIDRALTGVMAQRGDFDIEVVVANDASTDSTLSHIRKWQEEFPESIKVINHEKNVGFQKNYLSAVKAATGKYLCMCDADDYWIDRHKLQRQMAYMESHPECAVVFHRIVNVYEQTGVKTLSNGGQKTDSDMVDLSRRNFITNLSVMYRRELVPAESLPEWLGEVSLPDYAYHMLYAAHGKIHYIPRPMGVYSKNAVGAWSLSGRVRQYEMALDVRRRLMDYFGEESPAYAGLRDASVDLLVAIMASEPEDAERCISMIKQLNPALGDSEIDAAVARARGKFAQGEKMSLPRRVFRMVTRILPAPRVCR